MFFKGGRIEKAIVVTLIASLAIFFMPEFSWLAAQQQEGEALLAEGKQNYMEGRFEEAAEKLTLALKLLTDRDKRVDAYLHLGLSHYALGDRDKAKEDLAELLNLNPAQKLDPIYYPPEFISLFEEVKTGLLAQLKVDSDPQVAQVFLDGELVGVTPLELTEVAAGEHTIRIVKQGYKEREESFTLKVGEEKSITMSLEQEAGKPRVTVTPPEEKPEVKKKSNTMLWLLIGGAAAAAVLLFAVGGGGDEGGAPTPTPSPPSEPTTLTIRMKVVFSQANLEAKWRIFIDGQQIFEEWIVVATQGGANRVYGERTRYRSFRKPPGSFTLRLRGVDSNAVNPAQTIWVRSTQFELSVVGPGDAANRYRCNPNSFSLNVAPFLASRPDEFPRERSITINVSSASALSAPPPQRQILLQSIQEMIPK